MILYEFICQQCKSEFEELVSSQGTDEHISCPKCGSHDVRRLVSAVKAQNAGGDPGFPSAGSCSPSAGFS
jgi:putative FmdB family regulatory protein